MRLSPRLIVAVLIVALAIGSLVLFTVLRPGPTNLDRAMAASLELDQWVQEQAAQGNLARGNGYIYAVDVGQLMTYAALSRNRPLYDSLRDIVMQNLLVDDQDNPFTAGFIAWRYAPITADSPAQESAPASQPAEAAPPKPLDASGTTEALRIAEALWHGAYTFRLPGERDLAIKILHGYARHQYTDQGLWLIRNYYNLQTNAFAPHSFLVDYDPDLLAAVANHADDEVLNEVATRCTELVASAISPAGLLHSVIAPDILTLMPNATSVQIFSPNNIEQLSNTLTVAERCVQTNRPLARDVLDFSLQRLHDLRLYYDASTGQPRPPDELLPGIETYAPLLRLAVKLENHQAHDKILPHLLQQVRRLMKPGHPGDTKLYMATEALLSLESSIAFQTRKGG